MAYSAYDELLQRRLLEHGGAAGMGGGASAPVISPAGGGSSGPQMPSGIGGLLGRLFNGGGSSGPVGASRAQYMPEGEAAPDGGDGGGFLGGFGGKLMDFSVGASLGRNPNESFQYGLQSLYQGIGNRRADKKAQAELNRTRQVAISMGIPEDIAMNAPAEILVNVIKEAYAAGLKPKQPIILSKGQKALDAEGKLIGDNPDDSLPDAKYVTFIPPNTIPGAVPQTVDVSRPAGRAIADRLTNERWIEQRGDGGAQPAKQTREIDGKIYVWDPVTGELGAELGKASSRGQSIPQAVQGDAIRTEQSYKNVTQALDRFETLAKKAGVMGSTLPGKDRDALDQERRNIQLQLKELFNLGVLNGPDLALMEQMIFDPSISVWSPADAVSKIAGGVDDRITSSVAKLKEMLKSVRDNKLAVVKSYSGGQGNAASQEPPPDLDPAIWDAMTPEEKSLWQTSP